MPLMRVSELRSVVKAPSVQAIEIEVEIGIVRPQKRQVINVWVSLARMATMPRPQVLHWPGWGLLASGHGVHACG